MGEKSRVSLRRRRASHARSFLLALLCFALPAAAQGPPRYWFLDLTIEPARSIDGTWYEAGTLLDSHGTRFDRNHLYSRVMGYDGQWHETEIEGAHAIGQNHSTFFSLPWNDDARNIWCDPTTATGLATWSVVFGLLCLPLLLVPIFSAIGSETPQRYWWLVVSLFMFLNEGNIFKAPIRMQEVGSQCAEAQALISAHPRISAAANKEFGIDASIVFLPFKPAEARVLRAVPRRLDPAVGVATSLFWQVIWFVCLVWQIPAAIVGLHYTFVRHPAERLIRRQIGGQLVVQTPRFAETLGMDDPTKPPPEFVSRNKTRRIQALTDLLKAETAAARAVIQYERERRGGKRDDKKR